MAFQKEILIWKCMATASSMEMKSFKELNVTSAIVEGTSRLKRLLNRLTFTLHQLGTKHPKFTSPFSYLFILRPINILTPHNQHIRELQAIKIVNRDIFAVRFPFFYYNT